MSIECTEEVNPRQVSHGVDQRFSTAPSPCHAGKSISPAEWNRPAALIRHGTMTLVLKKRVEV